MEQGGEYELSYSKPISICHTKNKASKEVKRLTEYHKKICDNAIKNTYGTKYDLNSDDWKYSSLCNEFIMYIFKLYFPHVEIENIDGLMTYNLIKEETEKLNKLTGDFDSETFINWCFYEKGLSQEVIDATIEYNKDMDYNSKIYYIEEVGLIE